MNFTPRKVEREAIVAVLEDETYADAASMADDVIKAAYGAFLGREWYMTVVGDTRAPSSWAYGLFPTQGAATKAAVIEPARVWKVWPGADFLATKEELTREQVQNLLF